MILPVFYIFFDIFVHFPTKTYKNTWQTTFYSLSGVFLIPHWIASVGQTFLHLPQRIHSGLLEFSTGSTIIWHAFAHFPHFIHLSLSTLYLYRETVKKDSDTENPLDGGKYTLYAGNDIKNYAGQVIVTKGTALETVTTGEDGKASYSVDLPISNGYYVSGGSRQ